MKFKSALFIILAFVQFTFSQNAELTTEIQDHIKARVDEGFNPSVALAYIEGENVTYFNYGNTEVKNGKPVDQNTVYEIGSISKVFTTIILADEILKGNINLSDPISKYLPKTVIVPQRKGKQITIKDLATHTSGLPRMPDNFEPADYSNPFADYSTELLYQFLSSYELLRDIGVQYEYSNLGMGLLGHILELHTGKTYEELVKTRITVPLGMKNTGIVLSDAMKAKLALGHNEQLEVVNNWNLNVLAGAGAIRSTTSDMVKFIRANTSTNNTSLSKAMKLSHEIAFSDESESFNIALGWHFANNNTITWHNGGTGGYRAFTGFLNDFSKGVVVLTNSVSTVDAVGMKLLDAPLTLELPKKSEFPDEIEVSAEVLENYIGVYQLAPEFSITITRVENQLFLQATNQPQFKIFPSAEHQFFLKVVEANITFSTNDAGEINALTLHQGGQNLPGNKVE
ncbi:CubicO group peptidase (beta-lactamase class C family) [Winogradskyella pacifica]|uniref:Beta-lactamase n=1 Tax=Winogradskyella pacifica TaxID=664642 RepID=A0A3D9MZ44_9FLAO|nr:serine hydrolase [Winogradskyella pacifica]REE25605.1 CubicO group peptidase (beta-lactamase class C family) [Winogradskyella pacifica]